MDERYVAPMGAPMRWLMPPDDHQVDDTSVTITAPAGSDRFVDPSGGPASLDAPALITPEPEGDYVLSARVDVAFTSLFDAGLLLLWQGPDRFAKLCLEYAPGSRPMVVSVVTRQTSDDANGAPVDPGAHWLRIARVGPAYAFHSSADGRQWALARSFRLDGDAETWVGFGAQAPTGSACRVRFDDIRLEARTIAGLRDGS